MNKLRFKLFITGHTPRSECALLNLRKICDGHLAGEYELSIIDVLEQPDIAERERVIATPMLIKEYPPPSRRIIGDLSDSEQLLSYFGLFKKSELRADQ
jgi:circadian clock protein KaiB